MTNLPLSPQRFPASLTWVHLSLAQVLGLLELGLLELGLRV